MATKFKSGDIVQCIGDHNSDGLDTIKSRYVGYVFQISAQYTETLSNPLRSINDTLYEVRLLKGEGEHSCMRVFFDRDLVLLGEVCL